MNTKRVCMTILALLSVTMLIAMGFSSEVAAENKAKTTNEQKPNIKTLTPLEVALNVNKLLLRISADIDTGQRYDELKGRLNLALARIEELDKQHQATPNDAGIVSLLMSANRSLETNVTSLLTIDNQLYIVPNSKIWGDVT